MRYHPFVRTAAGCFCEAQNVHLLLRHVCFFKAALSAIFIAHFYRLHMRRILLLSLILFSVKAQCQLSPAELSGTWTGNYYGGLNLLPPRKLVVEIGIYNDTIVRGSSHLYHRNGDYEHYTITGVWNPADSTILFVEDSVLDVRVTLGSTCLGQYTMRLAVSEKALRFDGRWRDKSAGFLGCPPSKVYLTRGRLHPQVLQPALRSPALDRPTSVQSLIELAPGETDSVRVEISDNAEIDGDVVSLYLDDVLILSQQRIEATPHVVFLSVPHTAGVSRVRLVAESEGSMPPCTAHMLVTTAAGVQYNLDLSSSLSATDVLELFRKE